MTRARSFLFLTIISSLLFVGFASPAQTQKGDAKPTSVSVTPIDVEGLKQLVKRDPAKARPLLINFWATWCDPCRDEFPDLVRIDTDYRSKGLELVAISLDDVQEIKTGVPKFLGDMKAQMPAYLLNVNDPEPAITFVDPQWSGALPATVLYDSKGNIAYKRFGRINDDELRSAIDKALKTD
jgi:thiol-disulfide isomerase/thioredoxin